MICDLRLIAAEGSGFDPEWEKEDGMLKINSESKTR